MEEGAPVIKYSGYSITFSLLFCKLTDFSSSHHCVDQGGPGGGGQEDGGGEGESRDVMGVNVSQGESREPRGFNLATLAQMRGVQSLKIKVRI